MGKQFVVPQYQALADEAISRVPFGIFGKMNSEAESVLLARVADGDTSAVGQLLAFHSEPLTTGSVGSWLECF